MRKLVLFVLLVIGALVGWKVLNQRPAVPASELGEEAAGSAEDPRYEKAVASLEQLAFAVEDYDVERGHYPARLEMLADPDNPLIGFLPADPYSEGRQEAFAYRTDGEKWILLSRGPDGDVDFDLEEFFPSQADRYPYISEYFRPPNPGARFLYDRTNGPTGDGDIIYFGPD